MKISDRMLTEEEYKKMIESKGGIREGYTLDYEEYRSCVLRAAYALFHRVLPSKNPKSALIVAPAGSGKTGLSLFVQTKFAKESGEGFLKIDPDVVGVYHKHYEKINDEIPEHAYDELQKFIQPLLDETIRKYSVDAKINNLSEGTFASTNSYIDIIKNQKENGFEVEVDTIVIHYLEQLLSCFTRQQDMIDKGLEPRINSAAYCKKTYDNFMKTLKTAEEQKLLDDINVYVRGKKEEEPVLVWSSKAHPGESAIDIIEKLREDGLKKILDNKEDFVARIQKLKRRVERNPDSIVKKNQLEQIAILESEFEKYVQSSAKINNDLGEK